MLVHDGGDLFVLKGFALHDVAPVAGGVADAEQDRFVLHFCLVQGFLAPWVPVYRVVCVLQQIWTRLVDEPVGVLMLCLWVRGIGHDSSKWERCFNLFAFCLVISFR